ncbi:hypothetical protein K458DRAFT_462484 [Lentithecium fluviatile CBS 122367]|uniref:F-box domain-containing protein n=1 Tax=Lentithecium fluviatile CBS 122367 TaxID=1168545 RepID=A0A6G1JGW0_9PLEO|nr:hypothetical protein K458DRAFT_462484 [Lentithecium fluviatile CBS 122367]
MIEPQPESTLLQLPYEIHIAICSHMPPFHDCDEYFGLFLCCKQVYNEVEREAVFSLNAYLQQFEKVATPNTEGPTPLPGMISITAPTRAFGETDIEVKLPFVLPSLEHIWHHVVYHWAETEDMRQQGLQYGI